MSATELICPSCGQANRETARFCEACGHTLLPSCPSCGAEVAALARYCNSCGAPMLAADALAGRKVVTVVFADLAESTALQERLDAESSRAAMSRFYDEMQAVVEAHGRPTSFQG